MALRTILCEDELHARVRLRNCASALAGIEIVAEAESGIQAVEMIDRLRPDLVFLDIEMPGCSGFEVLEKLNFRPGVIFVTAYDQYAIRAFEENAVDYLLKPVSQERLEKAIQKFQQQAQPLTDQVLEKLRIWLQPCEFLQRFAVKCGDDILLIPRDEVIRFSAEDKYVFLYTSETRYFYDGTLKELETRLDPDCFIRIHKSHIVALQRIRKLKKRTLIDFVVELDDSRRTVLKIGRSYLPLLKGKFH